MTTPEVPEKTNIHINIWDGENRLRIDGSLYLLREFLKTLQVTAYPAANTAQDDTQEENR